MYKNILDERLYRLSQRLCGKGGGVYSNEKETGSARLCIENEDAEMVVYRLILTRGISEGLYRKDQYRACAAEITVNKSYQCQAHLLARKDSAHVL